MHDGKTLVAVKASDEATRHVHRILTKAGAESVQGDTAVAVGASPTPIQIAAYDEHGKRVDLESDDLSSTSGHTP